MAHATTDAPAPIVSKQGTFRIMKPSEPTPEAKPNKPRPPKRLTEQEAMEQRQRNADVVSGRKPRRGKLELIPE